MKKLFFLLALASSITLIQSCQKESLDDSLTAVAPQLPPLESFVMPFTGFKSADTPRVAGETEILTTRSGEGGPATYANWFHAAANVLVWNVVLSVSSSIPVASFAEAFNHRPVSIGDGAYLWTYNFNVGRDAFQANLTGRYVNNEGDVEWTMKIAQIGGFGELVWYTGVTSRDNSEGSWTLYHDPQNYRPFIGIKYQKNDTDEQYSIRYTNIDPNDPANGHYIEFRTHPNANYNRAYDVYQGSNTKFLQIEWNEPGVYGRVKDPSRFGDNEWHCWNNELKDVDC